MRRFGVWGVGFRSRLPKLRDKYVTAKVDAAASTLGTAGARLHALLRGLGSLDLNPTPYLKHALLLHPGLSATRTMLRWGQVRRKC